MTNAHSNWLYCINDLCVKANKCMRWTNYYKGKGIGIHYDGKKCFLECKKKYEIPTEQGMPQEQPYGIQLGEEQIQELLRQQQQAIQRQQQMMQETINTTTTTIWTDLGATAAPPITFYNEPFGGWEVDIDEDIF